MVMQFKILDIKDPRTIIAKNTIPNDYKKYIYDFAIRPIIVITNYVDILYQSYSMEGITVSNNIFFVKKPCTIQPTVPEAFSAINIMLKGNVPVNIDGKKRAIMYEGRYNAYQINSEKQQKAYFEKEDDSKPYLVYEAMHFDYSLEVLKKMGSEESLIKEWYESAHGDNSEIIMQTSGYYEKEMKSIVEEIKKTKIVTYLDEDWLRHKAENILLIAMRDNEQMTESKFSYQVDPKFREITKYIRSSLFQAHSLASLSEYFEVGISKLRKDFIKYENIPFKQFLIRVRMEKAQELLLQNNHSIQEIAEQVGYPANFARIYKYYWGYPPSKTAKCFAKEDVKVLY